MNELPVTGKDTRGQDAHVQYVRKKTVFFQNPLFFWPKNFRIDRITISAYFTMFQRLSGPTMCTKQGNVSKNEAYHERLTPPTHLEVHLICTQT